MGFFYREVCTEIQIFKENNSMKKISDKTEYYLKNLPLPIIACTILLSPFYTIWGIKCILLGFIFAVIVSVFVCSQNAPD